MSSHFDRNKPFTTRDGRAARILGELEGGTADRDRMVVAIKDRRGIETAYFYHTDGTYLRDESSHNDLVNPALEETKYMNVYKSPQGALYVGQGYNTASDAVTADKGGEAVGRVKVVLREGQFDGE